MPIKLMAASRRRPGLTRAEYFRYIEHYHGTVARLERFKIEQYIQNHVIDGAFGVLSDAEPQEQGRRPRRRRRAPLRQLPRHAGHPRARGRHPVAGQPGRPVLRRRADQHHRHGRGDRAAGRQPHGPSSTPGWASRAGRAQGHAVHHAPARGLPQGLPPALAPGPRRGPGGVARTPRSMFRKIVVSKRSRVNDNDAAARAHFKHGRPAGVRPGRVVQARQHGAGRAPSGSTSTPCRRARWSSPTGRSRSSSTCGRCASSTTPRRRSEVTHDTRHDQARVEGAEDLRPEPGRQQDQGHAARRSRPRKRGGPSPSTTTTRSRSRTRRTTR